MRGLNLEGGHMAPEIGVQLLRDGTMCPLDMVLESA